MRQIAVGVALLWLTASAAAWPQPAASPGDDRGLESPPALTSGLAWAGGAAAFRPVSSSRSDPSTHALATPGAPAPPRPTADGTAVAALPTGTVFRLERTHPQRGPPPLA